MNFNLYRAAVNLGGGICIGLGVETLIGGAVRSLGQVGYSGSGFLFGLGIGLVLVGRQAWKNE